MNLEIVLEALRNSWGEDTAQNPIKENGPASGQCCVSSMIIQDLFGGELLRAEMSTFDALTNGRDETIVHYWNELPGGVWVDSTRSQFTPNWVPISLVIRPKEYLWKFEDTMNRYEILRDRVMEYIKEH